MLSSQVIFGSTSELPPPEVVASKTVSVVGLPTKSSPSARGDNLEALNNPVEPFTGLPTRGGGFTKDNKLDQTDLIGSVQRALRILELLAQYPAGLNAKQVSLKLQLNLSTCYHLLNTLIASGYAVKDPDSLLFRLSGKIGYTVYGQASPAQLVRQLTPHVQALQEITQETAYLSLWNGHEIILSAIAESPLSVRVKTLVIGFSAGNHASALGKAILAYLDQAQLDHYLTNHELLAYTPHTLTDTNILKSHLVEVRRQAYSLDGEEFLPDVYCIGGPIFDAQGQILASIAIALPGNRYHAHRETLLPKVKEAAQAATRTLGLLGYVGPVDSL